MHYGALRGMKPYSKICDNFRALGNSAGFGYVLRAIAHDLVMCYRPQCRILLCAMGHSTGFCFVLWAIVRELILRSVPKRQPTTIAQDHTNLFLKACQIFLRNSEAK